MWMVPCRHGVAIHTCPFGNPGYSWGPQWNECGRAEVLPTKEIEHIILSLGSVRAYGVHGYLQFRINWVRRSGCSTGATDMRCGVGFCRGSADLCCVHLRPGVSDAVKSRLSHCITFAGLALLSHRVRPITFYTRQIGCTRSIIALRKQ